MRRIGLRQFNRNLYKEIRELPLIVTNNKKPYLVVLPYNEGMEPIVADNFNPVDPTTPLTNEQVIGTPPTPPSFLQRLKKVLATKIA